MPTGSSSALALAARLRALDDDALRRLLIARGIRSTGIRDWFDLAEALLDRTAVQSALERLDRRTLAVLAAAAQLAGTKGAPTAQELADRLGSDSPARITDAAQVAVEAGLLGEESGRYAPWDAVVEQLASWPSFGLPALDDLLWAPPPAALDLAVDADAAVDRGAGEHAFATTSAVTDLVLELTREPARRLAKGGIALPDVRRLTATASIPPEDLLPLLELAERAGVTTGDATTWMPGERADDWLAGTGVERWRALAEAWLDRLTADVRTVLTARIHARWGDGLRDYLDWYYPAGGEWMRERVRTAELESGLLGLVADGIPSGPGRALLQDGPDAAAAAMQPLFPPEVDRVYLQHDLSIISPGPLAARIDARLRTMADAENRGLASTYRVTASSISRALTEGETAESIRAFFDEISLTGVPQPLEYLLRDTAERFGSLRVGAEALLDGTEEPHARSYVRSDDEALIQQLAVDQALAAVALTRTGPHRLVSRFDPAVVYWSLIDARYPAVAEDADGKLMRLRRAAIATAVVETRESPADVLVARLRASSTAGPEATGEAWIARQLELAAKGKTIVAVTVRMPDGSEVELRLEPASVAGGRLRGRDARADLERTLPLSSITAVTPLT